MVKSVTRKGNTKVPVTGSSPLLERRGVYVNVASSDKRDPGVPEDGRSGPLYNDGRTVFD